MAINTVSWSPKGSKTIYAWRYPKTNLNTQTQLLVQDSQEAILFSKGQVAGRFGPGIHLLNTENLPVLSSLCDIPNGGKNPFKAEVWFVNKLHPYNIDWITDSISIYDARYNTQLPLVSKGRYGLKIADAEKFIVKIAGTKNEFSQYDLTDLYISEFSAKTKSVIVQFMLKHRIGFNFVSAHLDDLSRYLKGMMLSFWENWGLNLTQSCITSIEIDSSTETGRMVLENGTAQTHVEQPQEKVNYSFPNGKSGLLDGLISMNLIGGSGGCNNVYCSNCSNKFPIVHRYCPHCGNKYNPCPQCGTDNNPKTKLCIKCGSQIQDANIICPKCKKLLTTEGSYCGSCGNQLQSQDRCSRCKTFLPTNIKFCPKCGNKKS